MFSALQEQLAREKESIQKICEAHEYTRVQAFGGKKIISLKKIPKKLDWQIYDHCAVLTRTYSLYEQFVIASVSLYLEYLPSLLKYNELPDAIQKNHRIGIGNILPKIRDDGYFSNLNEQLVIQNFAACFSKSNNYTLLTDAFFVDPQNFRSGRLSTIFSQLGIQDFWRWATNHPEVSLFMIEKRGGSQTAQAELDALIRYRNEAAHGNVTEILSTNELITILDFIIVLCTAVSEFLLRDLLHKSISAKKATSIGKVIKYFPKKKVSGIEIHRCKISVEDFIIIDSENSCKISKIKSMKQDKIDHQYFQSKKRAVLGLKLEPPAKLGSNIYRCKRLIGY